MQKKIELPDFPIFHRAENKTLGKHYCTYMLNTEYLDITSIKGASSHLLEHSSGADI